MDRSIVSNISIGPTERQLVAVMQALRPSLATIKSSTQALAQCDITSLFMMDHLTHAKNLDECAFLLEALISDKASAFSPQSTNHLSVLYFKGGPLILYSATSKAIRALSSYRPEIMLDQRLSYRYACLELFHSMAQIRLGLTSRRAVSKLQQICSLTCNRFPELHAQALNLLSIVYGKLDDPRKYPIYTNAALSASQGHGLSWLEATIRFRELHKRNWAEGERNKLTEMTRYEDDFRAISAQVSKLPEYERKHIEGQMHAFIALNYRWEPKKSDIAMEHIRLAEQTFSEIVDCTEFARVSTEMALLGYSIRGNAWISVEELKQALFYRISIGDFPRLRYDLHWLAGMYRSMGHEQFALVCELCAHSIHTWLYGQRNVDSNLFCDISANIGNHHRLGGAPDSNYICTLENATGVSRLIWAGLFAIGFRNFSGGFKLQ